ncbi:alpha-(1,3)-fucosyltransferase 9-like [Denticeps clupeoides]|uniref:Fucosyltransferase n=1 Tax=Denticeps clupeoides TaxID=299321 RepID=A0AAY4BEH0_9TELE|nr:alpha-(1,3)-fucosyltransferase 9 [Denticeps clupeoides]XP_028858585.1 alpha-(1,3)-fucosyltransferase 9 [Denticeps clupeoides]XP_028858586.1 alpha-(1,3)-fucosyltransferase 9 [Denticeps clupeoides]XP_028858587.1 alpha-(1,3)-fucosyltransferase 9 [Denticeps clupeoides]XP_028858588.1 alpha-(1,3)-fucosyltransferase 9 [Denticeps clupeoides]
MPSASFNATLRPLVIAVLLLGCFVTVFFMYFKPPNNWLSGPIESAASSLKGKNLSAFKKEANQTIVLVWLWPFGQTYDLDSCGAMFNIEGCHLTADRGLYNRSSGVIIHHRDISKDLSNLPPLPRPAFQKWVWMNLESPSHSQKISGIERLFNLTLNYRQDADIQVPYGSVLPKFQEDEELTPPSKTKTVCWIVSNWNPDHARVKYYNELCKHIEIHTYGQAFGEYVVDKDFFPTISSCKFYLAFENSIHKDYITEKLYNPLSVWAVPVALGPSRQNYENFVPGDAFIHVDDFLSPKELAEHLLFLDRNQDAYLRYFDWRKQLKVKMSYFWAEHTCRACDYIKSHREYKVCNNLDSWFWD